MSKWCENNWSESDGELPSPESAGGVTEYTRDAVPDWCDSAMVYEDAARAWWSVVDTQGPEFVDGPWESPEEAMVAADEMLEAGPPVEVEVRTYKDWHPSELHAAIDDRNQCLQAVVPDLEATEEEHPSSWASLVLDRIRGLEMPT